MLIRNPGSTNSSLGYDDYIDPGDAVGTISNNPSAES